VLSGFTQSEPGDTPTHMRARALAIDAPHPLDYCDAIDLAEQSARSGAQ
jgi:hypothetical protein